MDVRRLLGYNVRRLRLRAGFSQEELAVRMGVEQGYVSALESGKRNPTALTLWHAALALNARPAELFRMTRATKSNERNRSARSRERGSTNSTS